MLPLLLHFRSHFLSVVSRILLRIRTLTFTVSVASENFGIVTIVDWNGIVCMTGWSSLKYNLCIIPVFVFSVFLIVLLLFTTSAAIGPESIVLYFIEVSIFSSCR